MKKLLVVLSALVIVSMILTACGKAPATAVPATTVPATTVPATTVPATAVPATAVPATAVPPTDTPVPPTATMGPPVMLDAYFVGGGDNPAREEVQAAINAYIQPLINAKITFHLISWGDWAAKGITALEAGEKMDIFFTADWNGYSKLVGENLLTPLNDPKGPDGNLLELYGKDILSSLNSAFINGSQIDGVNYAVPTNKELSVPWGFIYNATIAHEIGMTDADAAAIKTPADMSPWLAKAKAAHPNMAVYNTDGVTFGFMPWQHGFTGMSDFICNMSDVPVNGVVDETILNPMETQWMKDYLATMRDWYLKGYIPKDANLASYKMEPALNAGDFLFTPYPLMGNNIRVEQVMAGSKNPDLKLMEIYPYPKIINTSDVGGSMLAIPRSSPNPVTAMKFINLMHSDRNLLDLIVWGIKDKHYTLDPDGRVNAPNDPWAGGIYNWMAGDVSLQRVSNQQDPNTAQLLIHFADDAIPMPSLGFRWNPVAVSAEVAAVTTVVGDEERALLTGSVDPTTALPKYIADLKAAGLDKIIADVQKQYAAWKVASGKK